MEREICVRHLLLKAQKSGRPTASDLHIKVRWSVFTSFVVFFILLIASEGSTWRLGHWLFTEHCLNKTEMLLGIEHINADLRSIVVEGHNIFKVTNSVCYGRLYDDQ